MKKGITPIISVIILLLITIALAGAAWTYLQGALIGYISQTFQILPNGAFCTNGLISVYVQNTGYSGNLEDGDFIAATITNGAITDDLTLQSDYDLASADIAQGEAGLIINQYNCDDGTNKCAAGYHQLFLATNSMVQDTRVRCP